MTEVAAYVRVSSKAQSYATQKDAIEREAAARGDVVTSVREEKQSARTMDRPELARLREDVRVGRVRKLYVFKLDRLCRTGVADTFQVVQELRRAGVELVAVADRLTLRPDSDDVTSEVLVFALGLAAKLERAATGERIAAARLRVEAKGGSWGRPRRVGEEQAAKMAAMKAAGRSVRTIAQALGVPKSTVERSIARAR